MTSINLDSSIADIVTARPATAALFEQLGIDFCCGGERSLSAAASERGLDGKTLLASLEALAIVQADAGAAHDVSGLSIDELVDHILEQHHDKLRKQLPMIGELLDTVVRVHGAEDPTLAALREKFAALSLELTDHIELEESELFPACRAAAGSGAAASPELLDQLAHEHADAGAALAQLRELGGGYDESAAHCNTHRFLLQSLSDFERDLHLHVHEENNVLFPRARTALEAASPR
jgi:regulator of cell morphogenesis and NO signaling